MSEIIVGIDLGTTNSEIAVVHNGRVEVIPYSAGARILPSVVGIADDGTLLVGESARNQYVLHPDRTVRSIKRRMGEFTRVRMGNEEYTPQEISAMILVQLKKIAENYLGQEVRKAVITVPAFFSDAQRQATHEAGKIAGLEVVRIINEPTAAALAFENRGKEAKKVLVYDLGGGTFDVSVVNLEGDVVEVLSSHGDNHLGGDDFDRKIVDYILEHIKKHHGIDAGANLVAMSRLQRAAEMAKIVLSDNPFVTLSEEYLLEHDGIPVHLSLEISRSGYEAMIEPYISETLEAVHVALSGARLTVSDIDEVLLVGGATRTPMVSSRLEEVLGIQPRSEMDPDLCVAIGAAVQAGVIAGVQTPSVLIDVTPYTFGTAAVSELGGRMYPYCYIPLIRKNTPIPVSKSEVFYTFQDNQKEVKISVYQGEDPDALNNIEIGSFIIDGLEDAPSGNPIVTTFSLDVDGILHVSSREKKTGLERSIVIDNALSRFGNDKLGETSKRVQSMFAEDSPFDSENDRNRRRTKALALLEKANRFLPTVSDEDGEDLKNAIELIDLSIDGPDDALETAMNTLSDLLYYLEV